jgi:hypothetical protein
MPGRWEVPWFAVSLAAFLSDLENSKCQFTFLAGSFGGLKLFGTPSSPIVAQILRFGVDHQIDEDGDGVGGRTCAH